MIDGDFIKFTELCPGGCKWYYIRELIFTNHLALFIMPPNAVLDEEKNKQAVTYLFIN